MSVPAAISLSFVHALLSEKNCADVNRFDDRATQIAHIVGDSVYVVGDNNIYTMRHLNHSDLKIVQRYLEGILASTPQTPVNQPSNPST